MKLATSNINKFIPSSQRSKTGKARCVFYEMRRSKLRFFFRMDYLVRRVSK